MGYLDGQILFALICALILAWIGGLFVARWYSSRLLSFMQTGGAPVDESAIDRSKTLLTQVESKQPTPSLFSQNKQALWRYRATIGSISFILALVIAFFVQNAYEFDSFSLTRTTLLALAYAWPLVACLGLLEHWSRWRILWLSLLYMSVVNVLVMFNSYEGQSLSVVMIWLFSQQLPPLVFIFVLTSPGIRSVGPYLLFVFLLLVGSSLVGYEVLALSLAENGAESWITGLVEMSNAYVVFILFGVVPWFIAFFPLRFLARKMAHLYRLKYFSETLYLIAGVWLIVLLFQAMVLSHSDLGLSAYMLLISWLTIPIGFFVLKPFLTPDHRPPTLLLLRVFRADDSIGELFDSVLERWRYSGNTVMIAGKDLALRTLEPDELFSFLNGQLHSRFVSDKSRLLQGIEELDFKPDPDGRFRVNEFFCFDSTWKMVLETLVVKAGVVFMDLRAYTSERKGCSYELEVLASSPHLQKIIILFNDQTDKETAHHLLGDRAKEVVWVEESSDQGKLELRILTALLD